MTVENIRTWRKNGAQIWNLMLFCKDSTAFLTPTFSAMTSMEINYWRYQMHIKVQSSLVSTQLMLVFCSLPPWVLRVSREAANYLITSFISSLLFHCLKCKFLKLTIFKYIDGILIFISKYSVRS